MNVNDKALILVPKGTKATFVAKGSALVAQKREGSSAVRLYYEGNIYNACNLHDMNTRIVVAAGRLFDNYPTVAWMGLADDDIERHFEVVGSIDEQYNITITDKEKLENWANQYSESKEAS